MWLRIIPTLLFAAAAAWSAAESKTIIYSAQPNAYFNDHASQIKKFTDGFFFVAGDWSEASARLSPAGSNKWLDMLRTNIASLRRAGVDENFLGVSFGEAAAWPSEQTLLGEAGLAKMRAEFAAVGRAARDFGFRGVSIDVEYPYKRYAVGNPIWKYGGYTAEDLIAAAYRQGQAAIAALLEEYPDAAVILLPGELNRMRRLGREFSRGILDEMARRDAPGGLHLGSEYTYTTGDALSTLATCRHEDPLIAKLASARTAAYWKRRCTVAPGIWPLHIVETGGPAYPVQPWKKEVAELRGQMALLRAVAKRYIWSFTANPIWYVHTPEIEARYGLRKQDLKRDDIDIRDCQNLLSERPEPPAKWSGVIERIRRYDRRELTPEQLCDAFGTPGRWWVLGMLGHPRKAPQFAANCSAAAPNEQEPEHHGRDAVVRWFPVSLYDPRGIVNCQYVFDWRATDFAAAHFAAYVHTPAARRATLHIGWDDVVTIRWNGQIVFDTSQDERQRKGLFYLDKYRFEMQVPIEMKAGRNKLVVTSVNYEGAWAFDLRITGSDGVPIADARFGLD